MQEKLWIPLRAWFLRRPCSASWFFDIDGVDETLEEAAGDIVVVNSALFPDDIEQHVMTTQYC